jgi:hypothetical protein
MNILFCANDSGGANSIAPVIELLLRQGAQTIGYLTGPARDIFSARGIPFEDSGSIETILATKPDVFVAGTSVGNSLDKQILAHLGNVPSIYVLDFWLNYWQRFSTIGEKDFKYLPSVVCIMDGVAKEEMVGEGFPPERLVVTGNPHFDHFCDSVSCDVEDLYRILFVSQPVRSLAMLPGFASVAHDEYATLEDTISAIKALPNKYYLSIRLHPREPANKYDHYLSSRLRIASERQVEAALSVSGLVVGISSPVLMQAAAAGKKVLSYEPNLAGKDPLVSNRVGVTPLVNRKEDLQEALMNYSQGVWSYRARSMREVWPVGATERVVEVVNRLSE